MSLLFFKVSFIFLNKYYNIIVSIGGAMVRHQQIRHIFKDFRKITRELRDASASDDENVVMEEWKKYRLKLKLTYKRFLALLKTAKDLYWIGVYIKEEVNDLEKTRDKLYNEIDKLQRAAQQRYDVAYFTKDEEKRVREEVRRKQAGLHNRKKQVDKLEQEYIIKQEELEIAIKDTNLAKSSYYHLTEAEMLLFEEDREKILKGVEQYGSISLACQKDRSIKTRVSSIMHYAEKHKQFGQDIEIAKKVFKDSLDAELLDRALNGTLNPVFQKGEYIGDYAVKDNKLLVEVAKAKLPETYNPRAYAAQNPQSVGGTTINILSFDGVDETKRGYVKNIGVVKSVDDSGRVERITQSKKLVDFYKDKGAEILEAEVVPEEKEDK